MKKILTFILLSQLVFYCKKNDEINESNPTNPSNTSFILAKKYKDTNLDSAFIYFNLAKNDFLIKNDSIGAARSLVNMAIIQSDKGDYYGSIETSLEADKYLKTAVKNDFVNNLYSSNYNNLAISSKSLKNYQDAEKYYQNALKITLDKNYISVINNNIGDMLILQNKKDSAVTHLQKLRNSNDSISYARVLNNLAKAKFLGNVNYNAVPELEKALKIREIQKDTLGLNSSFATLADYFYSRDKNKSLFYAKMMLKRAKLNKSPDDRLEALQKLINLDKINYLNYFKEFQTLNDSVQLARSKAKNQFAVVRYDVEQKNALNQKLKADNEIEKIRKNVGIGSLTILLVGGFLLYRKRQKQLKQEKELEVKNTELRYSKKVHDKVANKVYHVMSEVENTENMNKEVLLYKLDGIYQISRDISYEKNDVALEHNFSQHLSQMLKSYSSETIKVPIIGNEESLWEDIPDNSKVEIFYILQELMTNMKKHSKADKVLIDFSRENDLINIVYSDNGIGISEFSPKNGLQNTESRINSIGGTINFDTKTENGLKINLSFPVKN
ncbi:tetratricopeptide repeat protein [Chryseobacterium aahli]|uniref:tetratricopeptide repeat-containing sensor histidine kinase n=1 Tax=Chryseobacterium aahli TaxID=1278643 RepID=UPI001F6063D2|nr:tetratricopeptide repeat-containing sensor histidine kinase [Chryseobacterium aahli]MCI3937549.1 tetratricopeptide repeat protein [Chryseobacterium aahli]